MDNGDLHRMIKDNMRQVRGALLICFDKTISFLVKLIVYYVASIFALLQLVKLAYFLVKGRNFREKKDRREHEITLFKEDPSYGRHKYISIEGRYYHYVEAGNPDGPLVMFLHGFPQCWYQWRHQLAAFSGLDYHLVALDLAGFGGSNPPSKFSMEQFVTDVRNIIGSLSKTRRAHCLVGHDVGGLIAYACAMQSTYLDNLRGRRGFINKLIISNVPHPLVLPGNIINSLLSAMLNFTPRNLVKRPLKTLEFSLTHLWLATAQVLRSYHLFILQLPSPIPELWLQAFDYDTFIGEMSKWAGPKNITKEDQEIYKAAMGYQSNKGIESAVQSFRLFLSEEWLLRYHTSRLFRYPMALSKDSIWQEQLGPNFGKIGYPTLILWGDKDPLLGTKICLENTSAFISELIEIRIPRAGHFLPEEKPLLFNDYLSHFISGALDRNG